MRPAIKSVLAKLHITKEKVEEYLDSAETANSPNEVRIDSLGEELQNIEEAIEALENIT